MKQLIHASQSLTLIAVVYMWEDECMAKLSNGLIWNLILTCMLEGENARYRLFIL